MLASWKAEENKANLHASSDKQNGLLQDCWDPDEKVMLLSSYFYSHPLLFLLQPHPEEAKST